MKNTTDYSDEFSTLKELHEDNIGRKFTDEEFNEIFSIALKEDKNLIKHAEQFQNEMMGLLMLLDEATRRWKVSSAVEIPRGNPMGEIQELLSDFKKVIQYYATKPNANWGDVGTLANIHESLGTHLYDTYDKHSGYSRSVEEGLKRHSEASLSLLDDAEERIKGYDDKRNLPDLLYWKNFLVELVESFAGTLHRIRANEKLSPELRRKLEEIFSVSQSHAISAWASEILDGRKEITEDDLKKIEERYKVVERIKREAEFEEDETRQPESQPKKVETKPTKKLSLREEAINLAHKLKDKELAKYLEKAPLKSIQRRIKALREESEKPMRKQANKSKHILKKADRTKR